jgi:hypothetical protein
LIHCIYKDEKNHVHAIHVAIEETPTKESLEVIKKELLPLAFSPGVTLYIFVPVTLFIDEFYFLRQAPSMDLGVTGDVVIVLVSKPERQLIEPKIKCG